jgi:hypothetical protein
MQCKVAHLHLAAKRFRGFFLRGSQQVSMKPFTMKECANSHNDEQNQAYYACRNPSDPFPIAQWSFRAGARNCFG